VVAGQVRDVRLGKVWEAMDFLNLQIKRRQAHVTAGQDAEKNAVDRRLIEKWQFGPFVQLAFPSTGDMKPAFASSLGAECLCRPPPNYDQTVTCVKTASYMMCYCIVHHCRGLRSERPIRTLAQRPL
jgi:hypothetical protein